MVLILLISSIAAVVLHAYNSMNKRDPNRAADVVGKVRQVNGTVSGITRGIAILIDAILGGRSTDVGTPPMVPTRFTRPATAR